MNTKKYSYTFFMSLAFVMILTAYPLFAQTSDEGEIQTPVVEIQNVEEEVQNDVIIPPSSVVEENKNTPYNVKQEETKLKEVLSSPVDKSCEIEQSNKEEPISKEEVQTTEFSNEHVTIKNSVNDSEIKEHVQKTQPDKCSIFIQRVINIFDKPKIKSFIAKVTVLRDRIKLYLSEVPIFKKYGLFECKVPQKSGKNCPYIVPFYYVNPKSSLDNENFKNIISDKITSFSELMPYNLANQSLVTNPLESDNSGKRVPSEGTVDTLFLMNSPSPVISVKGNTKTAKIVIDIRNNTLYKYNKLGFPEKAYAVATGARGMRTMPGLRIVTHKEHFPYSNAPDSKRGKDPYSYGPHIIFVNVIDPETGRQWSVEQLLHGNGNEASIGKKVSHGCVRTNNKVMDKELSREVARGDYILLINPDVDL